METSLVDQFGEGGLDGGRGLDFNHKIINVQNKNDRWGGINGGVLYGVEVACFLLQVSNMDLNEADRPKKVYNVIEPQTKRVIEKREKKQKKDQEQKEIRQKFEREREKKQKETQKMMQMEEGQKKIEMERLALQRQRQLQEAAESNTLSGRFGHMINDLNTNTTNHQFTISGMDLRPAQIKVLVANVQNNSSLKGLNMCRKNLTDVEGCEVALNLAKNYHLQRLELQGNNLGPETLTQISKLLGSNQSLRVIDLQGNKLIRGGDQRPNYKGIESLIEALMSNQTLLSLNLSSTGLDGVCSKLIMEMMQHNSSLILLDLSNNPQMTIEHVTAIQEALLKNRQDYDDQRYMEFIERKRMRREEDISGVLLLNVQTKKLRVQAIDLNIKTKKAQLDQQWRDFVASEQLKRQKEIVRMQKQAGLKKKKKKK